MIVLAAVLGSALTLGASTLLVNRKGTVFHVADPNSAQVIQSRYGAEASLDFTLAAEKGMPSVVHIKSTGVSSESEQAIPAPFRDFFGDDFFRPGTPQPRVGTGSGIILSEDGYIVTNNHVIEGAEDIEVGLNDNHTYKAELVGTDPTTDLALLKIDADKLTPITLGNSDEVRVGEWVLAIGNPFNLNSTVTAGIVSAKARNINILKNRSAIESFIQTDAAVNPGNSGGALVDLEGNLIGINTAIASPTGSYSGYAFAVPVNLARKVVEDLMQYGTVQRGYLGVTIRNVDGNLARDKNLPFTEGVYIDSVTSNGSAKAAGIRPGDVITAINGKNVKTSSELQATIGSLRPGNQVSVTLFRDGGSRDVNVTLKNLAGNTDLVKKEERPVIEVLGAELETLPEKDARRLNINGGVKVVNIFDGKLSQSTDIREGFIITRAAGKEIRSVEDLKRVLSQSEGGIMLEGIYEGKAGKHYYAFGL
ncbi:MAG: Do family serine endopeptidase [Bacteroidetes bacterium]|nr:MAG: Do family serine endopeptidase [Bacteroidota bacterium]